jgi:hypothetical protein
VVEGELLSYVVVPIGASAEGDLVQANRNAIMVTSRILYRKIGQKEPLWSNESFSFREEYDVSPTTAGYFDQEEGTIDRLAEAYARSLVSTMLEAF